MNEARKRWSGADREIYRDALYNRTTWRGMLEQAWTMAAALLERVHEAAGRPEVGVQVGG